MGYFTNAKGTTLTSLALSIGEDSDLLASVASNDDPDLLVPFTIADPGIVTIEQQPSSPSFPSSVSSNRKAGLVITGMKPGQTTVTTFIVNRLSESTIARLQVNVTDLVDSNIDLYYFGRYLVWRRSLPSSATGSAAGSNYLLFDASSGLFAIASAQNQPDNGPLPEGTYRFKAELDPLQNSVDKANAAMPNEPGPNGPISNTRQGIQYLPIGGNPGSPLVAPQWGSMRVRIEPTSASSQRGGFYLHNSAKGYTHGCVEIGSSLEPRRRDFFSLLVEYATSRIGKPFLTLKVKYRSPDTSTRGNTKI
jgi:hypothetical protein